MTASRTATALLACALGGAIAAACSKDSPSEPSTTPPANCNFTVGNEPVIQVTAAGGEFSVSVAAVAGCNWTASSSSAFITPMTPTSGSGNGTARFSVQANTGAGRLGSVRVADRPLDVVQASGIPQPCNYAVNPTDVTVGLEASDISITVTNDTSCVWSATSNDPFITVKSGGVGIGNGTVVLSIAASSATRSGTATVAGTSVTINQLAPPPPTPPPAPPAPGCAFTVSPTQASVPAAGGSVVITVTQTQGTNCAWTAQTQASFLTFAGNNSGTGSGIVTVSAAPNNGSGRNGVVSLAGQTVLITQGGTSTCSFSVNPQQLQTGTAGGSLTVTVTMLQGQNCPWTAQSQSSFLTVVGNSSGTGSGSVTIAAAPNAGAARTGTALIAGQTVTVDQTGNTGQAAVLRYSSDQGDFIGGGQSNTHIVRGTEFTATYDPVSREFGLVIPPAFGWWSLNLSSPSGQLAPGTYNRAARWPFQSGQPGLSFSGNGRGCNLVTGRFLISEAVYGPGNTVQRFHARFEQHCEGWSAALRGEIWIDAQGSTSPPPLAAFSTPSSPTTFLSFQSDPGDFIGGGTSQNYSLSTMKFIAWRHANRPGAVNIGIAPFIGGTGPTWGLDLEAPSGQPLVPGTYNNATRYPFQATGVPGLNFSGNGHGCNTLTGKFVVLEAVYGPQGEVERFHATFEQHCEGAVPALRGEIRIVADPWR